MSEDVAQQAAAQAESVSAGVLIRQAREAAGLHIAALSVMLKVSVRKLEALEADQWDRLGDATFVRTLAASVCRHLKIPQQSVLHLLPQAPAKLGEIGQGLNEPFRGSSHSVAQSWRDQVSRPMMLAVLAVLLAALAVIFFPDLDRQVTQTSVNPQPQQSSTLIQPQTTLTQSVIEPVALPVVLADTVSAQQTASASVPLSQVQPNQKSDDGGLVLTALAPVWVEVRDAQERIQVRRELATGEVLQMAGNWPLRVVVGRAQAVQVRMRGVLLDMGPVSQNGVAKFEVQ